MIKLDDEKYLIILWRPSKKKKNTVPPKSFGNIVVFKTLFFPVPRIHYGCTVFFIKYL